MIVYVDICVLCIFRLVVFLLYSLDLIWWNFSGGGMFVIYV